jgi:hypothetical protein
MKSEIRNPKSEIRIRFRFSSFGFPSDLGFRNSDLCAFALFLLALALPSRAIACAACYGQSDSALAEGMNMGVLFLLGVVTLVIGGFVTLFVMLARRAAAVAARQAASKPPEFAPPP